MTTAIFRRYLVSVAFGALLGSTPIAYTSPVWAASSQTASSEDSAMSAIGRARYSAQNGKAEELAKRIDDAEASLLNIAEVDRDPHVKSALQHLDAAKALARNKDLRGAEAELEKATSDLAVSLATADAAHAATDAVPVIGTGVYGKNNPDKLGQVTEIIFTPEGKVDMVVIDVGPALGTGTKNVAVPRSEVTPAPDRVTIDRSKEQLQNAAEYQLPKYSS
jgi:hypothetical protein